MPRRRPAQLRARLPKWQPRTRIPQVSRVSTGTLCAIAELEQTRLPWRGMVAEALAGWSRFVNGPARALNGYAPEDCPCLGCQWDDPVVRRQALLLALCALPLGAARELRALVRPLDERYLARVDPDPDTADIHALITCGYDARPDWMYQW